MEPDILYAVRKGESNESLRLSLRSLAHLPHRRVFIAGYCPEWVRGVTAIRVHQRADKFDNIERNVIAGLEHPEIGEDVVYMNDDFYFTQPIDGVAITHGGPISEYPGRQELRVRMRNTVKALETWWGSMEPLQPPLAYDGVHTPLPLSRDGVLSALTDTHAGQRRKMLWRTWYGNVCGIGGVRVKDTKLRGPYDGEFPSFLSTSRAGLQILKDRLEEVIPSGSPYIAR